MSEIFARLSAYLPGSITSGNKTDVNRGSGKLYFFDRGGYSKHQLLTVANEENE